MQNSYSAGIGDNPAGPLLFDAMIRPFKPPGEHFIMRYK